MDAVENQTSKLDCKMPQNGKQVFAACSENFIGLKIFVFNHCYEEDTYTFMYTQREQDNLKLSSVILVHVVSGL